MTFACRICGSTSGHTEHRLREMMYGTREEFAYIECGSCGTIQIKELIDVSQYYPDNYYSLEEGVIDPADNSIKRRAVMKQIGRHLATGKSAVGRYLVARRPYLASRFPAYLKYPNGFGLDDRILDVGAGNGKLIKTLKLFGFRHLTGIDPFLGKEVCTNGLKLLRSDLKDLDGSWDVIMFHHSLEHVPEPVRSLDSARRLLTEKGRIIVRIPIASYAWEKYGKNWFQLDPPRHLYTFTERSFRHLADNSGLKVDSVVYDSEAAQFFASEQYTRDISLLDARAYSGNVGESVFSGEQIEAWEREASELNRDGRGDQACFYLSKK